MEHTPDLEATVTLTETAWSGWDREGYPVTTWAKLRVSKSTVLSPATLFKAEPEGSGFAAFRYEVIVERIVADRVGFFFTRLVVKNPGGTIDLGSPESGRFILQCGESAHLATPTMDAGLSVSIELHEIR